MACGLIFGGGKQPDEVLADDTPGWNIDDRFLRAGAIRNVRSVTKTLKASAAQFDRWRNADGGTGESANPIGPAPPEEADQDL
jgi:hypothetical protein